MLNRACALFVVALLALALFGPEQAFTAERCTVLDAASADARQRINDHLCFYSARPGDPAHSARFPGALPENLQWQAAQGHDLVFSHTDAVYWVTLTVRNSSPQQAFWFLKLSYPLLDEITFWQHTPDNPGQYTELEPPLQTGDRFPFASRGIDYRYYLLPVTLDAQEERAITLRIHSSGALNVPLSLVTPGEAVAESNHLTLVHGLFYGALLVLAVFNLVLFFSSGTRYYFFNAFYIVSMALFLFAMGGLANQYFWPDNTELANQSIPLGLALCSLAMVLFGGSFLEIESGTLAAKAMQILAWTSVGFLVASFILPYSKSILLNTFLTLSVIASLSVIATIRWRQGYQPAFWYLGAWLVMVVGALLYALAAFGHLGDYQAREVMMQAAIGAQVVLLNYALVQRWRLLNQKLLDIEQQARTELEFKVHERTTQLRNTMQELEQANRKLASLSLNDALTGLHNRRHMDNIMPELCAEARRTGQPLTLALVDADHFKRINDTWGHDFGDQCLKKIADNLAGHVRRPRDVAIRFGGEEFALLLPETTPDGANTLCQSILQAMRTTVIRTPDGADLCLTLSAGIAALQPGEGPRELFRRADEALYTAKAAGRDQVRGAPGTHEAVTKSAKN